MSKATTMKPKKLQLTKETVRDLPSKGGQKVKAGGLTVACGGVTLR